MKYLLMLLSTSVFADMHQIMIKNNQYIPREITVKPGDIVEWTNNDFMVHTVTSGVRGVPNKKFNSGNMMKDKTFRYTFDKKGYFDYYCIPHFTFMKGKVIVK